MGTSTRDTALVASSQPVYGTHETRFELDCTRYCTAGTDDHSSWHVVLESFRAVTWNRRGGLFGSVPAMNSARSVMPSPSVSVKAVRLLETLPKYCSSHASGIPFPL